MNTGGMMRRYKKKELKRDEFKETIQNLIIFYEHHKQPAIWIIMGILIVIIVTFSFRNHARTKFKQARKEYNIGVVVYNSGDFDQAQQQFEMVKNNFWGTSFAHRSTFMLANIYYNKGQIDKALQNFQDFVEGDYDELFTPGAYEGIAKCYEQKGDLTQSLEYYQKALDKFKYNTFKTDCLMHMGRIYLGMQWIDKAENIYKEALNLTNNSTIRKQVERKLKTIEALKEISG